MRKKVVGIALALGLLAGVGTLGVINAAPVLAQEVEVESQNPFQSFIQSLIDDGVISQEQGDTIAERAEEARAEFGELRGHRGAKLETASEVIGIETDELREALQSGSTLAEIATENGVEPQSLIDEMVEDKQEKLDEAVADGRLTEEEAAEKAAEIEQRVTDAVNGEIDFSEGRRGRGGPGRGFGGPPADADVDGTDA